MGELRVVSGLLAGESDAAGMLVVGEAGVGKSRLVTAAGAAVAARADVLVLSGWCLGLSAGLPFLPVMDGLRAACEVDEGRLVKAALAECPPFVVGELARLAPELGEAQEQPGPVESGGDWRRERLFEALRRLWAALAQLHRVAVVVEDVQWADTSTLEVLEYLLAPGHASGVPVLLTCRSDETQSQTLSDWLDGLLRNPRIGRLDLAPLSQTETGEQIELLLGRPAPQRLVADIYSRSEGNAFFTEQLVAAETVDRPAARLPVGLRSLLLSRTGQVAGAAREILDTLAVGTRPLDEASLSRMCDRPEREVRDALRELLAGRLLRRPDAAGRYQLRHALLAEAIIGELLPGELAELHAHVADTLADADEPSLAAQIAEHYAAAHRSAAELRWRVRAGRHAETVFAPAEAARHWQRALALSADAPITQLVEGMTLAELYAAAEDALELSGSEETARALGEEGLVRLAEADPGSRADVLRRAGHIRGRSAPQQGLDLLYQALALYEQIPPGIGHVATLRDLIGILDNCGRHAEAAALVDQAAVLAERAGLRTAHLQILCLQAWHELAAGNGDAALHRVHTLAGDLAEQDEPSLHAWLAITHTDILLKLGRLTEVEAAAASALRLASTYRTAQSFRVAMLRANVFEALTEIGSIDAAAQLIDPVTQGPVALSTRFDFEGRALLEMLRGNLDGAQQRWAELRGLPARPPSFEQGVWLWEAEAELWRRAPERVCDRTYALLVRSADADRGKLSGPLLTLAGPLLVLGLRACADLAEQARAGRHAEDVTRATGYAKGLSDLYERVLTPDPFTPGSLRPTATADGAMWRAEWSRLGGQSDAALWERAATAWDALSRPHRAGYARWRQAEALLAGAHGRAAAGPVLRTAVSQAGRHLPLSTAIRALANRAHITLEARRPATEAAARPASDAMPYGLTARELAVLQLLATGRTNAQIGAELFISPSTAGVHVSNILRKLDVPTRVQAAAVAERAGLLQNR